MTGTARRLIATGLTTLGVLGGGLLLPGASALGAEMLVFQKSFGTAGTNNGQFSNPTAVAVNQSTGEVYVLDKGHDRVEQFSTTGEYHGQFNGSEAPTGVFSDPNAIAVDSDPGSPSFGDVYVSDGDQGVIDKFTSSGVYINQLTGTMHGPFDTEPVGAAIDPSGNLLVYESEGYLDEFNDGESNSFVKQMEPGYEITPGIAVDSADNVYFVSTYFGNAVKFVPAVEELEHFASFSGCGCVTGVAVDPVTNNVYVDQGTSVVEYGPFGKPLGKPVTQFGFGHLQGGSGIAVIDAKTRSVYVADSTANNVDVFTFVTVPDTSTGAVSHLQGERATVAGTTNPDGIAVSSCEFEYGTSEAYSSNAECSPAPGSGNESVPVTADLTGLLPGTLYHYRLAVANANGANQGAEETFRTPAAVGLGAASNVSPLGATLNATVEPGPVPTSYHFAYGTSTAYGQVVPVPDLYAPEGYAEDAVSQTLTGLQPGTTYHYAVVANSPGGTVTGPDEQFTTPPVPLPEIEIGGASEVTTGSAALAGTVDPMGWDTSYQFQYGTSTGYGQNWPSLAVELGAFEGAQGVIATVEGLQPGTLYHYRLVASNPGGTSYGPDQTFTTASYPASVMQVAPVGAPIGIAPPKASLTKPKANHKPKKKKQKKGKSTKSKGRKKKG